MLRDTSVNIKKLVEQFAAADGYDDVNEREGVRMEVEVFKQGVAVTHGAFRKTGMSLLVIVLLLFAMVLPSNTLECHAKDNNTHQFSKDFKAYPSGSPEAVVTSFIEYGDLGKGANRGIDERYPLFWSLTESGEVLDNSQHLIIKSYKIDGKSTLPTGDVIVSLKMDVRAIALYSCDSKDSRYNHQINNCNWRDRVVVVSNSATGQKNRINTVNTEVFYGYLFGDNEVAKKVLSKNKGIYAMPKATRDWTFEIKLVQKKGKWLISQNSIPIEAIYITEEIRSYKKSIKGMIEGKEICEGKRAPAKGSFFDSGKYMAARCKNNEKNLREYSESLKILESIEEN